MSDRDRPTNDPETTASSQGGPVEDGRATASRRRFLGQAGRGAAAIVGGGLLAHQVVPHGGAEAAEAGPHVERASVGGGGGPGELITPDARASAAAGGHAYGGLFSPPPFVEADHLDALTIPPVRDARPPGTLREFELVVSERQIQVADGTYVEAWTYNGTAPGPILRATEGDRVRVRVVNKTGHAHNLHLHGRHAPAMDGWEPIPPGGEFTYEVTAAPAGVHPYHCHTFPLAEHIARGLYGTFIVDPVEPRPDAHEYVLMLSGWDADGDGVNEVYAYNGLAGFHHRYPIKVPVGDRVRLYVLNMTEHDPIASFHLHAQTFDVYPSGTGTAPSVHTDTVALTQGERAILEVTFPELGRYMFHPHQHRMAERGAMGWFSAI